MADDIIQERTGYDSPDGFHHGVEFRLMDEVRPDHQGDGPGTLRIHDRTEAFPLAEQDVSDVRLGDDGDTAVLIDNLDQESDAAAFEECQSDGSS